MSNDPSPGYNIEQLAKQGSKYIELPYGVKVSRRERFYSRGLNRDWHWRVRRTQGRVWGLG